MRCFIDLSGTQNGRERDLYNLLIEMVPRVAGSAHKTVLVSEPDQFADVASNSLDYQLVTVPQENNGSGVDKFVVDELDKELVELGPDSVDESLYIVSFRIVVQHHLITHPNYSSDRYEFLNLRELLRTKASQRQEGSLSGWPLGWLTKDYAIRSLLLVLHQRGVPVPTTSIRPFLSRLDSRFTKDASQNRPTDNQKFIKFLLETAQNDGVILLTGNLNNRLVSLTTQGTNTLIDSSGNRVPTASDSPESTGVPRAGDRESERYLQILKANGMGPFQEVRAAIYDQIEQLLSGSKTIQYGISWALP